LSLYYRRCAVNTLADDIGAFGHRPSDDWAAAHGRIRRVFEAGADAAEAGYEAHAEETMREGLRLKEGCVSAFLPDSLFCTLSKYIGHITVYASSLQNGTTSFNLRG
jgi:hypothetical protein